MARLDFFLTTSDIHSKLVSTVILPGYRTDHSSLILEIQLHDTKRGKGFWKFNTSLLHNAEYVTLVKNTIKNIVRTYSNGTGSRDQFGYNLSADYQTLFEMIKLNIRGQTIAFNSKKVRERNKIDANLEEKIKFFEKSLLELCKVGDTAKTGQIQNELEQAKLQLIKVCENH